MRRFHTALFALIASALALTACTIKEDMSGCPTDNLRLMFRYLDAGHNDVFQEHIYSVEVLVFDESGCFVTRQTLYQSALTQFQGVKLKLAPGTYRIIAWANAGDYQALCNLDEFSTVATSTVTHLDRNSGISSNGDPLYYAPCINNINNPDASMFLVDVPLTGRNEQTLDFTGAHNTLEIYVKGFTDNVAGTPTDLPFVEVSPLSQGYNFSMQTLSGMMSYEQRAQYVNTADGQMGGARFFIPQFENDNPILIHIKMPSTGETVWTVNLKDFLTANGITVSPVRHDRIQIQVAFFNGAVQITMPSWAVEDTDPVWE